MNLPAKLVSSWNPDGQVEVESMMMEAGVPTSQTTVPSWFTVRMPFPAAQLPATLTCMAVQPGQVIWVADIVPATSSLVEGLVVPMPTLPGLVVDEAKIRGLAVEEVLTSMPPWTRRRSTTSSSPAQSPQGPAAPAKAATANQGILFAAI